MIILKAKIKELYLLGHSSKQIADILGKKDATIRKFINRNLKEFDKLHEEKAKLIRANTKLDVKEKIKELYLKGYNAKEIAKMLQKSHGYIRNLISTNLRECSKDHRKARDLNKSIINAINSMNNSYISDASLLRQNRQSYKYDKNFNLVFDEESRSTRPHDVPKKFYRREAI